MNVRIALLTILAGVALAVGGCQEPQRQPPAVLAGEQTVSVEELAARLRLRVEERTETFVVLKNAANTVLIFTHADGRFFVNGKAIGPVGQVRRVGGTTYVPQTLLATIQPLLQVPGPEQPPVTPRPRPKPGTALVVVDAGHGGKDPGSMVGGRYEKHITLQVATKVAALLAQQGVNVVMTRRDDSFIELEDRARIANDRDTDLFVSIHADSAPDRSISGFTVYVARDASPQAYEAARAVSTKMLTVVSDTRGIREADYKVLVQTACPAILIECGYLSNPLDARRLQDSAFQTRLAQAIAAGILNYLQ
jgi:N-acetylmuramoyl-L-alanine amidase